jgi:hypothetical protein
MRTRDKGSQEPIPNQGGMIAVSPPSEIVEEPVPQQANQNASFNPGRAGQRTQTW